MLAVALRLTASLRWDTPSGPSVVVAAFSIFELSAIYDRVRFSRPRGYARRRFPCRASSKPAKVDSSSSTPRCAGLSPALRSTADRSSRATSVAPSCDRCAADTGQIYTADIAPYFTILLVGHVVVPLLLLTEQHIHPALWVQVAIWPTLALVLTLWFLPRVKGCIMGLMWALGMRGRELQ
jgi:uncharacterized protein (DUF983 family)